VRVRKGLVMCLSTALSLAACQRQAGDAATVSDIAPTHGPAVAAAPAPVRAPMLIHAVLDDPQSDSPFRWPEVELGRAGARVIDGELWAPAAPLVDVLQPGATVQVDAASMRVDGRAIAVPLQPLDGETFAAVAPLAQALGGYARRHPDDGSVTLWPAAALHWLATHGDPRAPVLAEARAAGIVVD
jgi:hypothetical protein